MAKHKIIKKNILLSKTKDENKLPKNIFLPVNINEKVLDIGCGKNKMFGAIGIDIADVDGVDFIIDIDKEKLPFKDNFFDRIYCMHTLEHCSNIISVMNEIHRIGKHNCINIFVVPYGVTPRYLQDPTHKTPITEDVVHKYLCTPNYVQQYSDMNFKGNFELLDLYIYGKSYNKLDMYFILKTIKKERIKAKNKK